VFPVWEKKEIVSRYRIDLPYLAKGSFYKYLCDLGHEKGEQSPLPDDEYFSAAVLRIPVNLKADSDDFSI